MRTLQTGTNGFTCMVAGPSDAMCLDSNAMAWAQAWMAHTAPPDKVGFVYMLAGDNGASNTDPYATGQAADNHWVKTGPHRHDRRSIGPNDGLSDDHRSRSHQAICDVVRHTLRARDDSGKQPAVMK